MRISKHATILTKLAVSSVLFAQSVDFPIDRSRVPDIRQIVESSIAATQRHWQARLHYTYLERDESRRRDPAGHLKSEDIDVTRTILVDGVPFEQLVERNGCEGLGFLGIELSESRNATNAEAISIDASRARVRVIRSDEDLMIAHSVRHMLETDVKKGFNHENQHTHA